MIPEHYRALMKSLTERTAARTAQWKPTSRDNEFVLYFEDYSISLKTDSISDQILCHLRSREGKMLDTFEVGLQDVDWHLLESLLSGARRSALGLDEAVQRIMAELQTKAIVGLNAPPTEEDDFPF